MSNFADQAGPGRDPLGRPHYPGSPIARCNATRFDGQVSIGVMRIDGGADTPDHRKWTGGPNGVGGAVVSSYHTWVQLGATRLHPPDRL
jgi:hypothetical protein